MKLNVLLLTAMVAAACGCSGSPDTNESRNTEVVKLEHFGNLEQRQRRPHRNRLLGGLRRSLSERVLSEGMLEYSLASNLIALPSRTGQKPLWRIYSRMETA